MPEHELGTAHGSIEIDASVEGVNSAIAQMAALRAAMKNVETQFHSFDKQLEEVSRQTSKVSQATKVVAGSIAAVSRAASSSVASVTQFTVSITRLNRAMEYASQNSFELAKQGFKVYQIFSKIRNPLSAVSDALSDLGKGMLGITRELNAFPSWTKYVLGFSAAVAGIGPGLANFNRGLRLVQPAFINLVSRSVGATTALIGTSLAMSQLYNSSGRVGTALRAVGGHLGTLRSQIEGNSDSIKKFYQELTKFAGGAQGAILGAALMTSGLKKLWGVVQLLMNPKAWLFAGAMGAGLAALAPASSIILGLVDAVKQLSGAFLILPGALAVLGTAGVVAKVAFKGVGEAFKAASKDGEEFEEAIKNMSPGMQDVARAAQGFKDEFKDLKRIIEEGTWHGLSATIKELGSTYMPILRLGAENVSKSLNMMVTQFGAFLKAGRTVSDVNELFGITGRTVRNLSQGLRPVLEILRDVAMVGAQVFEEMTRGVGVTTRGWADFIRQARETGKLRDWIEEGVEGFKDLGRTIRDVSVGISSLFTGLGGNGDDALARMADSAARFREAMSGSHSNSGFNEFVNSVQNATDRVKELAEVLFGSLGNVLESTARLAAEFGDAFVSAFTTTVAIGTTVIDVVASIAGAFGPFASIAGTILGVAAAIKGMMLVLGPAIAALKVLFGMGMIARGFSNMMLTAAVAVETLSMKMGASQAMANRMTGAMMAAGAAANWMMAAVGALVVGVMAWSASSQGVEKANEALATSSTNAEQAYRGLVGAFKDSQGVVTGEVIDQIAGSLGTLRQDLEATADTHTGFMADLGSALKDSFNWDAIMGRGGWSKMNDDIDETARKAEEAAASFNELGLTNEELARSVSGTDQEFKNLVSSLAETSNGGAEAIARITERRQDFLEIKAAMDAVGPSALAVSDGLAQIGEEGASASDKLNGLMTVMRSLGLIESTAEEAAMSLADSLDRVVREAENTVNAGGAMGTALLDGSGKLKATEENGRSLYQALTGLRQEYYNFVAAGGDANAKLQEMMPSLIALGQQYGFNEEQVRNLIATYGFLPDKIETIMSVAGKDQVKQDLIELQLLLEQAGEKPVKKTISLETQEAYDALRQLGVNITEFNPKTGTAKIDIPPGLGPETVAKIQGILDASAAANPPKVTPQIEDPKYPEGFIGPKIGDVAPEVREQFAAAKAAVESEPIKPTILPPDFTPVTDAVNQAKTDIQSISDTPININVQGAEEATGAVAGVTAAVQAAPNEVIITVTEQGSQGVIDAMTNVGVAADGARIKFELFVTVVSEAMQTVMSIISMTAQTVDTVLGGAANNARGSGERLGQGFADGIASKAAAVQAAAMKLAEAASAPLPRSPAKIGPFSGKGWTPYRGVSLAEGFAQGIMTGTPLAQHASLNMAQAVSDVLDTIRAQFNMPMTSFGANRFGPGITNYYRDPEVSDAELAEARRERKEEEAKQARKEALRNSKGAADKLPNAEERLRKADERIAKAEERLAKAKTDESRTNAQESLDEAKRARFEAEQELNRLKTESQGRAPGGMEGGLAPNKERTDYINAMNEIAKTFGLEMTSDLRPGDPGWHGTGRAADFSNGFGNTDQQLAFADFMERNFKPYIKELIYDDPRFAGREVKDGKNVDSSFYDGAGDHTDHVHLAVEFAPEFSAGGAPVAPQSNASVNGASLGQTKTTVDPTRTDLSREEVASIIIARGRAMGMSDEEISSALATGLVESELQNLSYGDRDSLGAFQQRDFDEWTKGGTRNRMNVDDAATTYYEQLRNTDPNMTPGQRAQAVQRSDFPDKYDARLAEAEMLLDTLTTADGQALEVRDTELNDDLTRLRANDAKLDQALRIATDPNSSDAQVINALQDLDASMANLDELDQDIVKAQKDAIMTDRGIKEYDPFEGALKTDQEKFEFALGAAQTMLGIYNTLKNGIENASNVAKLLTRGISNTNDVHSLVDGIQGMMSTVSEIVSAVGSVVNIIATVAATAGAAIPGIGQVGAVVSAITGGIANVNAVVDLVQEVVKIGSRIFGGFLSSLLGGENGQLMGNVRTLLDFNDNTIKTWSDRNPTDKTVRPMGRGSEPRNPNQAGGIRDLNIYQGPGGDPRDAMNAAMFAVKAHSQGVFAG